jgi:flavorubredoxin
MGGLSTGSNLACSACQQSSQIGRVITAIQAMNWAKQLLAAAHPSSLGWQGSAATQLESKLQEVLAQMDSAAKAIELIWLAELALEV